MRSFSHFSIVLLCLSLTASPVARAAVQVTNPVHSLDADGWQIGSRAGRLCLVKPMAELAKDEQLFRRWYIGVPTLKNDKGQFLAVDSTGDEPTVLFTEKKGEHTHWAFEITQRFTPRTSLSEGLTFYEGESGFKFRLQVAEGKYKGWYLAADKPPDEDPKGRKTIWRALKVTKDVKQAVVFTHIEKRFNVGHK